MLKSNQLNKITMGRGPGGRPLHEIDDTRGAAADDAFEEILSKIIDAGGKIEEDENHPLYTDIGMEEYEIGYERKVKFNINKTDFQLIRRIENYRITGAGKHKSLEELSSPRAKISLKKKADYSEDWQIVDVDEMF